MEDQKKKKIWRKRLHGKFIRDTEDIADIKSWYWLWNGHSKRERESLITSAQEQYIRTNKIKTKIDGTRNDPKWQMCKANDETITHIISKCPKRLQKNANDNMTGWERLCIGIFVERKALMFPRSGKNTNI